MRVAVVVRCYDRAVTVAAAILAATPESVLRDVQGVPNVRRLVDLAWAGGAVPVVVVAPDRDGGVVRALAGAPVTYAEPAPRESGPVGQICRAIDVASAAVSETDGALVWTSVMSSVLRTDIVIPSMNPNTTMTGTDRTV